MLDLDHGTYPFVTSSNPIASGAATGMGIGPTRIDRVLGVSKAYVTRVGEGPFPSEIEGPDQDRLRELGGEFGTVTGRERRCGWLDLVALRYAVRVNGMTSLALTKLDVLSAFEELPVCVRYRLRDGSETEHFPAHQSDFHHATPCGRPCPGWRSRWTTRPRSATCRPPPARTSSSFAASWTCRSSWSASGRRANASSLDRRRFSPDAWTQIDRRAVDLRPGGGRARPGDGLAARQEGRSGRAALAPPRGTAPRCRTRRVAPEAQPFFPRCRCETRQWSDQGLPKCDERFTGSRGRWGCRRRRRGPGRLALDDVELGIRAVEGERALCEALLEQRERSLRPRAWQRARLRDRCVAAGLAELAQELRRHTRTVDREEHRNVVRRGSEPGDHACDRRTHDGRVVEQRGTASSPALPTASSSSHASAEDAPAALGQRLVVELARAPWASRSAGWRRRRAGRPSARDAPRLGVDVQPAAAHEAAERHPAVAPRAATASDDGAPTATSIGTAGDRGLLHELEREAAADAERPRCASGSRPRRTPSRSPCPSRCGARRPRARRAAAPCASKSPWRAGRRSTSNAGCASRSRVGQTRDERRRQRGSRSRRAAPRRRSPRARPCRRRRTTTSCRSSARAGPGRTPGRRARPCSPRDRRAVGPPPAAALPRARSRARAPRRGPGVRIVTATGRPPMRISSGSSTATTSSVSPSGTRTTSTRLVAYGTVRTVGDVPAARVDSPREGPARRLGCARARARVAARAEPEPDRAPRRAGQPRHRRARPLPSRCAPTTPTGCSASR